MQNNIGSQKPDKLPTVQPHPRRIKRALMPGVNDLATTRPEVAALWDKDLNADLKPNQVLPGSNKKVWWRCEKGHAWQAPPYALTLNNSRCPYCVGKKVIPGENDLATRYPDVAVQWDSERNGIFPSEVMPASKKKYWWRCEKNHRWQATVCSRALLNSGCPYCSGHRKISGENDIATRYPEIMEQWDAERNEIDLSTVAPSSRKSAWWRCKNGHSWYAQIYSVAAGKSRCPICAEAIRERKRTRQQEGEGKDSYMRCGPGNGNEMCIRE